MWASMVRDEVGGLEGGPLISGVLEFGVDWLGWVAFVLCTLNDSIVTQSLVHGSRRVCSTLRFISPTSEIISFR